MRTSRRQERTRKALRAQEQAESRHLLKESLAGFDCDGGCNYLLGELRPQTWTGLSGQMCLSWGICWQDWAGVSVLGSAVVTLFPLLPELMPLASPGMTSLLPCSLQSYIASRALCRLPPIRQPSLASQLQVSYCCHWLYWEDTSR